MKIILAAFALSLLTLPTAAADCVRMLPQDIIHLYDNVRSGSALLVV